VELSWKFGAVAKILRYVLQIQRNREKHMEMSTKMNKK